MQYLTLCFLLFTCALQAQTTTSDTGPDEDGVYKVVEQMPVFRSDSCAAIEDFAERKACADLAMLQFVYDNVTYPTDAKDAKAEGMAVIGFIVEPDGTVSEPSIYRDPGTGLGDEALRVVKLMEDGSRYWEPGLQEGEPVRTRFMLPIKFALEK